MLPEKRIKEEDQLELFVRSHAYRRLTMFILRLTEAVRGRPNSFCADRQSDGVSSVLAILEAVEQVVDQHPPVEQQGRFGNPAFRSFCSALSDSSELFVSAVVSDTALSQEISHYLAHSFGDRQRIDYGTGHELNFLSFLLCLFESGVLAAGDEADVVLRVFNRYMALMRRLQSLYLLEPAGSRGVWGLDDFHFLPFLFGASQLAGHGHIKPKSVRYPEILEGYSSEYMYISCIKFICYVKTASFHEHSPMLSDVSNVRSWEKVAEGMLKMYQAEVFQKLAVMQHFFFGSILSFEQDPDAAGIPAPFIPPETRCEVHRQLPDGTMKKDLPCCSNAIRFPSALSAKR